jgi:hypothetical protein
MGHKYLLARSKEQGARRREMKHSSERHDRIPATPGYLLAPCSLLLAPS